MIQIREIMRPITTLETTALIAFRSSFAACVFLRRGSAFDRYATSSIMKSRRTLRSRVRVWFVVSAALFFVAWLLPSGKDGGYMPASAIWWVFITGDYICSLGDMLTGLGIMTLSIAVAAAFIGAILQYPVCLVLDYRQRRKMRDETVA
jgi:hypothetical protein